ncbi:hypothetical protein [Sulfolobus tengchongensis spindle-shaped virus 4]|nr:hypothetical protein [Sulfolobus tengchongensis spindle-shaped virus 4]
MLPSRIFLVLMRFKKREKFSDKSSKFLYIAKVRSLKISFHHFKSSQ